MTPYPFDSVNRAITEETGEGPLADALRDLARASAAGASGGGGGPSPNRFDLSVNSARVEGASSAAPLLITLTAGNTPGGFNGGGTGNKGILGCKGHAGLPLSALTGLAWEWQQVSEEPAPFLLYANLIVDLGGGNLKVFVVDPLGAASLNTGTLTTLGPGHFRFVHAPATHFVQVVQPLGFPGFSVGGILPGTGVPVPVAAGFGPDWHNASFRYSDILASFPGATLVDASTGDGGLPKTTVTPAVLLIVGDSGNQAHHVERLLSFTVNGAPA